MGPAILCEIQRVRDLNARVREFEIGCPDGAPLPGYAAGAHIDVKVPGFGLRQYSLVRSWSASAPYVIAVQREDQGRGGSLWMHTHATVGSSIEIHGPRNNFPLTTHSGHVLLIAGGIGITPLIGMAHELDSSTATYEMAVCVRDEERLLYANELLQLRNCAPVQFRVSNGKGAGRLDAAAVLASLPSGGHVYCCGPRSLMDAVRAAAETRDDVHCHFEAFRNGASGSQDVNDAFNVICSASGITFTVRPGESLLAALARSGIDVETSCQEGCCGSCITSWTSGQPIHRDTCLSKVDRDRFLTVCTARAEAGTTLVLDL